jgi:hypothetical protein
MLQKARNVRKACIGKCFRNGIICGLRYMLHEKHMMRFAGMEEIQDIREQLKQHGKKPSTAKGF